MARIVKQEKKPLEAGACFVFPLGTGLEFRVPSQKTQRHEKAECLISTLHYRTTPTSRQKPFLDEPPLMLVDFNKGDPVGLNTIRIKQSQRGNDTWKSNSVLVLEVPQR